MSKVNSCMLHYCHICLSLLSQAYRLLYVRYYMLIAPSDIQQSILPIYACTHLEGMSGVHEVFVFGRVDEERLDRLADRLGLGVDQDVQRHRLGLVPDHSLTCSRGANVYN